jgi:hypothetical protein
MSIAGQLARSLDQCVSAEIEIYRKYVALLAQERSLIVASKADKFSQITSERERLIELMAKAQETRFSLMRSALGEPEMLGRHKAPPPSMKLSAFVTKFCSPREVKMLLPKVDALRKLVSASQRESLEFSHVVGFSLTMVSGLASLLWSATKTVIRSYTCNGNMKEAVHDGRSRKAGVLKEV